MLLRALCRKLERRGLVAGKIERILSARVPIIKFVERSSGQNHGSCFRPCSCQRPHCATDTCASYQTCLPADSCMARSMLLQPQALSIARRCELRSQERRCKAMSAQCAAARAQACRAT